MKQELNGDRTIQFILNHAFTEAKNGLISLIGNNPRIVEVKIVQVYLQLLFVSVSTNSDSQIECLRLNILLSFEILAYEVDKLFLRYHHYCQFKIYLQYLIIEDIRFIRIMMKEVMLPMVLKLYIKQLIISQLVKYCNYYC